MKTPPPFRPAALTRRFAGLAVLFAALLAGCGDNAEPVDGYSGTGGAASGGAPTGGVATGGVATGGVSMGGGGPGGAWTGGVATGGTLTGGVWTGGVATGGVGTGGVATGGVPTGGVPTGGTSTGGAPTGGVGTGGASTGGVATGGALTGGQPTGGVETGGTATGGAGGTGGSPTFHVFLLLGQSNMEGYPKAQQADRAEDDRIRVLGYDNCGATGRQTNQWDLAAPPLHSCWNDALGPGDYFAKTLVETIPEGDSIGLVPCAISGERIETFLKVGGTQYDWIIQRAQLAQQAGGVIEGILFHQGESNNGDSTWPGKVSTLVEDLRADLGLGQVPFIAGELLYSGGTAGHNTLVNQLPSVVTNGHVVSASGLVVDPVDVDWQLHFDHDSQVTLGTRYAQKMIEVLAW